MILKESLPKSLTSLSPKLPSKIWINNQLFMPGGAVVPVYLPRFPDHGLIVVPLGAVVVMLWLHKQTPTHLQVINRSPFGSGASVKIRTDIDGDIAYTLEPQAALSWTDSIAAFPEELARYFDPSIDGLLIQQVSNDLTDPNSTKDTGSGNMTFFHPCGSPPTGLTKATFLDAAWRKKSRRCRNWVNEFGMPMGMFATKEQIADMKRVFGEWTFNSYGLNPWDEHHLDGSEEYQAFSLTGHPVYLHSLLTFYYSVRCLGAYIHKADGDKLLTSGGAPRVFGWWLALLSEVMTACSHVRQHLKQNNDAAMSIYDQIIFDVIQDAELVLDSMAKWNQLPGYYEPSIYGSVPSEMRNEDGSVKPHLVTYQYSVLLWGLSSFLISIKEEDLPSLKAQYGNAVEFWKSICASLVVNGKVASYVLPSSWPPSTATEGVTWQPLSGTSLWFAPAAIQANRALESAIDYDPAFEPVIKAAQALSNTYIWAKKSYLGPLLY